MGQVSPKVLILARGAGISVFHSEHLLLTV
jgi:hypothetical protein